MPLAIPYSRVSSAPQEHGDGLARQAAGATKWIADHPEYNLTIDYEAVDIARSAWRGEHLDDDGALGLILRQVKNGSIPSGHWLIVEALDRLSRQNVWKANHQLSGLVIAGITVVTTIDNKVFNLKTGPGEMILSIIKMAEANQASEDKSIRVRSGKARVVEDAKASKYVPYQNAPAWLRVDDAISKTNRARRIYRVLDNPAEIVRTIYDLALYHGAGYITAWLVANRKMAFGKSGRWNTHYVRRILKSKAVVGHLETTAGLIENILPPLIDEQQWLLVQAEQDRRKKEAGGGSKLGSFVNLYRGIGKCAECGGMMRTNTYPGKTYRYLECVNHVRKYQTCNNRSRYRVDILDTAVMADFGLLTLPQHNRHSQPTANIAKLNADLTTLRDQEKRLAGRIARADNDDVADALISELKTLRTEVITLTSQLVVARKTVAVANAPPICLSDLTDRTKIQAALRQQGVKVVFGYDNEAIVIAPGIVLSVIVRRRAAPPQLLIGNGVGKVIAIRNGKLGQSVDAPAWFPQLDVKTGNDILALLRRLGAEEPSA